MHFVSTGPRRGPGVGAGAGVGVGVGAGVSIINLIRRIMIIVGGGDIPCRRT